VHGSRKQASQARSIRPLLVAHSGLR
jgi:hypothetical protein